MAEPQSPSLWRCESCGRLNAFFRPACLGCGACAPQPPPIVLPSFTPEQAERMNEALARHHGRVELLPPERPRWGGVLLGLVVAAMIVSALLGYFAGRA